MGSTCKAVVVADSVAEAQREFAWAYHETAKIENPHAALTFEDYLKAVRGVQLVSTIIQHVYTRRQLKDVLTIAADAIKTCTVD